MKKEKAEKIMDQFIDDVKTMIFFWLKMDKPEKEKLEGLAFSILVALDGNSGGFSGSIEDLEKASRGYQLHERFYQKENE